VEEKEEKERVKQSNLISIKERKRNFVGLIKKKGGGLKLNAIALKK
jgi:hypothetical protein